MKLLSNLKVGSRLALGFGIVLVLMMSLAAVAIGRMSFIQHNLDQIVEVDAVKIRLVNAMRDVARYQAVAIRDVVMQEDFSIKKGEMKRLKEAGATYRSAVDQLGPMLLDDAGKGALTHVRNVEARVKALSDDVLEMALADDHAAAGALIREKLRPAQLELVAALDLMLKDVESASKESAASARSAYSGALTLMATLAGVALVAGLAITFLIQRSVAHPLRQAVVVAERVASGDLTQVIRSDSADEVGQLLAALSRMNLSLVSIVTALKAGADNVSLGSNEIAAGNLDLSARTETQASALQQTAASMEQLGTTVQHTADNARQANQLAAGASDVAQRGGDVVGQVVSTMKSINESSKKIAEITSVIDTIAFQTNILALNAAVEAARAGEQGRGFAVVAGEVRSLAQRSAGAAKEIKALISTSVDRVEQGAVLADRAGGTMEEVVTSIRRVADIVGEISSATLEQSAGVSQVGQAVAQLDQATQQNAALVEQSAAAAENLKRQAEQLVSSVSAFSLPA